MPARRSLRRRPLDYAPDAADWPSGNLERGAPPEARLAQGIGRRLAAALGDQSVRAVAEAAGLAPQTVHNLLGGLSWGDSTTIAALERALGADLWGREHRG